jgi:septum formation protein
MNGAGWRRRPSRMWQRPDPPLVLASASSSRRALLEAAGLRFDVSPAPVDEASVKRSARAEGLTAGDAALLLAELKARHVSRRRPDALVIGADQILVCENAWYDKPADMAEARAQLQALRGRTHALATGVVGCQAGERIWHHLAEPDLTMRRFSDRFLDAYLADAGDSVTTTVGAYRLESLGIHLFSAVAGAHDVILGLPLLPLLDYLRQRGILDA